MAIFIQVVEQGGFARAADAMQLHRPTVTKAIQYLEDELGAKLLNRTTRKVSLTDEGTAFYQRTKLLLNDVDDIIASFSPLRPPRGRIRVNAPLSLLHAILVPELGDFHSRYPHIDIVLSTTDHKIDLLSGGIDCMIRMGDLRDTSLLSRRLGDARMVTCASPDYLAKHGVPLTPEELSHHQALNFFSEHSREALKWRFIKDGQRIAIRPGGSILVDNTDILLTGCLSGLGLMHGVHAVLAPYLHTGRLVEVLADYATVSKPIFVIYPDRRNLPPRVQVFIDWVTLLFARHRTLLHG